MSAVHETLGRCAFEAAVSGFLQERLQARLETMKPDDPRRNAIAAGFAHEAWMAGAALRVKQLQAVTHTLKPIHPEARGTNLYVEPLSLPALDELGSHALGERFVGDVTGNAAALDVYKLLQLEVNGRSLLSALLAQDAQALAALHADEVQAQALRNAFLSLLRPRAEAPSSHAQAKQLYWLTGADACDDAHYTLLAPLHATSLAHAVHLQLQQDRFGQANKAARQARRERKAHDGVFHDYPGLAVQHLGGSHPQNVSQLNSERQGLNHLLSSLPVQWLPGEVRPPVEDGSVFDRLFPERPAVHQTVQAWRQSLAAAAEPDLAARQRQQDLSEQLLDELVSMAAELHQHLPPGWSLDGERFQSLHRSEQLWLDPLRAELPDQCPFAREWLQMDWPTDIGMRFDHWLQAQLGTRLPDDHMGADPWEKLLLPDGDVYKRHLTSLRQRLDDMPREVSP